jgi:hypothetical protein
MARDDRNTDRPVTRPRNLRQGKPRVSSAVQEAVSDSIAGRAGQRNAALNRVTQAASERLQNETDPDLFEGAKRITAADIEPQQKRRGLRNISHEELREGLASGALAGTFRVEGRDPESLRSARDAAGVTDDGSLVFDRQGLRRLGSRVSVSGPQRQDLTDPNVQAQQLQAGLITEEEADRINVAQSNRVAAQGNVLEAATSGRRGRGGSTTLELGESIANTASDLLGLQEGRRIPSGVGQVFFDNFERAARSGGLPEGADTLTVASQALAIAESLKGAQDRGPVEGLMNAIGLVDSDIDTPQTAEPIFGLMRNVAQNPGETEFQIGGQTVDIGKLPDRVRTSLLTGASRMREGFVDSAISTFAQTGEVESLTEPERNIMEKLFEQEKERRKSEVQRDTSSRNLRNAPRAFDPIGSPGARSAGSVPTLTSQRRREIRQARDRKLKEIEENFQFEDFIAERAQEVFNGR